MHRALPPPPTTLHIIELIHTDFTTHVVGYIITGDSVKIRPLISESLIGKVEYSDDHHDKIQTRDH